jgi:predicted butyrate kinase (DUF1464 family)
LKRATNIRESVVVARSIIRLWKKFQAAIRTEVEPSKIHVEHLHKASPELYRFHRLLGKQFCINYSAEVGFNIYFSPHVSSLPAVPPRTGRRRC